MKHLHSALPFLTALIVAAACLAAGPAMYAQVPPGVPQTGPIISVSDLDFGAFVLGIDNPKTLALTICNESSDCSEGTDTLRFSNPGDPDPTHLLAWLGENFTVSAGEIAGLRDTALTMGNCYTIHVTFTPRSVGLFRTTARVWGDTRNKRDTSVWTAMVTPPGMQVSGHAWGSQWITAKSGANCTKNAVTNYSALVYVRNNGTQAARINSIELIGPDADAGYFRFDNTSRSSSILPGDECRVLDTLRQKVVFQPAEERVYSALMRVVGANDDTVFAVLSGTGIESHGCITGIDFDTVTSRGLNNHLREKVVIKALPTRPLRINSVDLRGGDVGDFWVDQADLARMPIILMPGQTTRLSVEFRPATTVPGVRSSHVVFAGDQSLCDDSTNIVRGTIAGPSSVGNEINAGGFALEAGDGAANPTAVHYRLGIGSTVRIEIFNSLGARIATLVNGPENAGEHRIVWDAAAQPNGMYYCKMTAAEWSRSVPISIQR